jgi:hypothetical protein
MWGSGIQRKPDWFFRVRSKRMTRIEELKLAIDDGVASEDDVLEYEELKAAVDCVEPAQSVAAWKGEKPPREWWLTGQYDNPMFALNEKPTDPDAVHVIEATPATLAAHDLLKAAESMLNDLIDDRNHGSHLMDQLQQAVNKAKGYGALAKAQGGPRE